METILFIFVTLYAIYLNLRIKNLETELFDIEYGIIELDTKINDKAKELDKDIKACLKTKIIERPRGRSTKRSRKVSKD
jgi:cell division protein FtsL